MHACVLWLGGAGVDAVTAMHTHARKHGHARLYAHARAYTHNTHTHTTRTHTHTHTRTHTHTTPTHTHTHTHAHTHAHTITYTHTHTHTHARTHTHTHARTHNHTHRYDYDTDKMYVVGHRNAEAEHKAADTRAYMAGGALGRRTVYAGCSTILLTEGFVPMPKRVSPGPRPPRAAWGRLGVPWAKGGAAGAP